jgi:hypothetical protein
MSFREGRKFSPKQIEHTPKSVVGVPKQAEIRLEERWRKTLNNGMHGLCFSMYEDGQGPGNEISEAQVDRRMQIIKPHTKWVRSFSKI